VIVWIAESAGTAESVGTVESEDTVESAYTVDVIPVVDVVVTVLQLCGFLDVTVVSATVDHTVSVVV
jgi:hypothetical protein